MGKRLINVDEVEEIVPVLVGKLLENNLITEEQANQIICAIFTPSSWWSTTVCSDVFSLTETESYYKQQSPNLV